MSENRLKENIVRVVLVILSQTVFFIMISIRFYLSALNPGIKGIIKGSQITLMLVLFGLFLSFLAIRSVKSLIYISEKERASEIAKSRLYQTKETINVLRSQRHDAISHIQVISGLVQLGKKENALDYIYKIDHEISNDIS